MGCADVYLLVIHYVEGGCVILSILITSTKQCLSEAIGKFVQKSKSQTQSKNFKQKS